VVEKDGGYGKAHGGYCCVVDKLAVVATALLGHVAEKILPWTRFVLLVEMKTWCVEAAMEVVLVR